MDIKKMEKLMAERTKPVRVAVEPVDFYGVKEKKPNERTVKPNARPNGTTERFKQPEVKKASIITELKEGVKETTRATERYSFEIYTDQIEKIEELQYKYKKRTGKKISASRIIREALEVYLEQAEQ